jgi:hypothetical protein
MYVYTQTKLKLLRINDAYTDVYNPTFKVVQEVNTR